MTPTVAYRSYAKLNLHLDVLNRRNDGYHNIETIFQTVDLGDTLQFSERRSRISLNCNSTDIDAGEDNLVWRAADLLRRRSGCRLGVRIDLEKRIPVAAGLGGGSGNAAAALVALNALWGLGLDKKQLAEFALELGSDVPFCLDGGTAAGTGRGEVLTRLKPPPIPWFVLLHPPLSISTSRIFNHPALARRKTVPRGGHTPAFKRVLEAFEKGQVPDTLINRFETVVFADQPKLAVLKQRLLDAGCTTAAMSGTGPTLFGICNTKKQAQQAAETFPEMKTTVARRVKVGVERTD